MRYLAIVVNTTIDPGTLGFPTGIPILEEWDKFIDTKVSKPKVILNYIISLSYVNIGIFIVSVQF